ncbi:hypothetical protein ACIRPX_35095 [Streptomyces sp. NPDC101225]|uniref:hypothetical protein n=1 Tax=Streptomyces sp. NPDC101225 TaxID=3366135 RepID=UPI0037FFDDB7
MSHAGILSSTRLTHHRRKPVFTALAVIMWGRLLTRDIDPVVTGLAVGLATSAYLPTRDALDEATTTLVRPFRERSTPELARSATRRLTGTLSANARLQPLPRFRASFPSGTPFGT